MKNCFLCFFALLGTAFGAQVSVLGINDMHADIDYMPQLATFLKNERAVNPGVLLLAAGDNRTGNPYVDTGDVPGLPMVQLMNRLSFDLSTLGNHEFDSGADALRRCMDAANFTYVCANVRAASGPELPLKPYHIFERDGVRIGVLGLVQTGENGLPDAHPAQCAGLIFRPPFEVVRDYAYLRERCDVLILLTHIGFEDDVKLARFFPEADAIVGGHSHTRVDKEFRENGVLITQAENKLKYITRLTFEVEGGKVLSKKSELLPLRRLAPDADMQAAVQAVKNNPYMLRVLTQVRKEIRHRESLGCLMADALRAASGADIGVLNIGGVRLDSFPAGPLSVEDCYRLDPFGNKVVLVRLTGRELIEFLNAVPANDHHGAPCVSGMRYKATKPAGELKAMRITEAVLEDGSSIDPEATYTMATNTYLMSTNPVLPADPGTALEADGAAALIQFLETKESIDYSSTGRAEITIQ